MPIGEFIDWGGLSGTFPDIDWGGLSGTFPDMGTPLQSSITGFGDPDSTAIHSLNKNSFVFYWDDDTNEDSSLQGLVTEGNSYTNYVRFIKNLSDVNFVLQKRHKKSITFDIDGDAIRKMVSDNFETNIQIVSNKGSYFYRVIINKGDLWNTLSR